MPDSNDKPADPAPNPPGRAGELEARLFEHLQRQTAEEVWEQLQREPAPKAAVGGVSRRRAGEGEPLAVTVWRRWAAGMVGAAALLLATLMIVRFSGRDLEFPNGFDPDAERGSPLPVPKNLRWRPTAEKFVLFEGDDQLVGVARATNGLPGVSVYAIDLHGSGSRPAAARLVGTLWATNAAGATVIRRHQDQVGLRFQGTYVAPGTPPRSVTLTFAP